MAALPLSAAKPRLSPEQEAPFEKLPSWLRPDQVAELLGNCTTEHVRILRNKGAIEARDFRAPGAKTACWRFYKGSVREYLASRPNPEEVNGF